MPETSSINPRQRPGSDPTLVPDLEEGLASSLEGLAPGRPNLAVTSPQGLPPGLAPLPTLTDLLQGLRQRWFLGLTASLLGAVMTISILLQRLPYSYTAGVWLKLEQPASAGPAGEGHKETVRPAAEGAPLLLRSPPLLNQVLARTEVAGLPEVSRQQDPRAWLEQQLQVQSSNPTVLHLILTTEQPQTAAILLETLVEQFLQQLREQREQRLVQLREQRQRLASQGPGEKPAPAPVAVPAPQPKPAPRPAEGQTALARVELAWEQGRSEVLKSQAELTALQHQAEAAGQVLAGLIEEQLEKDPAIGPWKAEIARLQDLMDRIKRLAVLGEKDPTHRRYAADQEAVQKKIDQRRQEIGQGLEKQARDKVQEGYQAMLTRAQEQLTLLREREHRLAEEVRALKTKAPPPIQPASRSTVMHGSGASHSTEDPEGKDETLRRLGAEIHLLQLQGPDAVGVERLGEVETGATGQARRVALASLSGAGVWLFLLAAVGWLEFQARRVQTPGGLARALHVPVLGTLPAFLPANLIPGPKSSLKEAAQQTQLAEAADVVRTVILQQSGNKPAVLVVASAHGREGATSTACQLALSLARAWRRTLLIDGHFRRPIIHERLQGSLEPGLCELLRGESELAEAVQPTRVSRLWFLPAGQWDAHALQALAQETTACLFRALHEQYDVVVIDAGPLMPLADALLLGQQADAVILAARAGRSRLPWINDAWYRLGQMGVPLLGVVVNGTT